MNAGPAAIATDNLTRRFGSVTAVDSLSLSVAPGELFGLIGPDGAGKTTTLRMLASIMVPSAGTARVLGRDIVSDAEAIKGEIGYMSQRFGLYQDLTVAENMDFYADIFGVPQRGRPERVEELLAFSNLAPFRRRRAGNLSGGMKQKLGLACALIHTPRVLFLDEPTNGVDPVSRRDFWRILYRLQKDGVTIFVTTAYLDEADRCHRVGLIHKGRLLACDTPDGLKGLMHGTILEVRTDNVRTAARLLREALPAATVGLFGDRVHVVCADPDRTTAEIRGQLARAGVGLQGLRPIEPSLEDVFVSVLTGREGAHGA
jgi:ABC-2 type transport system ATP-binding protein